MPMRPLKTALIAILCVVLPANVFAQDKIVAYNVKYSGGSLPSLKTGESMLLCLDTSDPKSARIILVPSRIPQTSVPAPAVTELSYGQEVHRRVGTAIGLAVISLGVGALAALSKSKKHFIGIVWDAGDGKKGGFVVQADKNQYRGIIAGLEGLTGKSAIDTDKGKPNS